MNKTKNVVQTSCLGQLLMYISDRDQKEKKQRLVKEHYFRCVSVTD